MATISENVLTFSGALQHKRGTSEALSASDYVPAAGEIVIATDTGRIKAGDGVNKWDDLHAYDETDIQNNYTTTAEGSALDATKGKDLNDRLASWEGITNIDCGVIEASGDSSGENNGGE